MLRNEFTTRLTGSATRFSVRVIYIVAYRYDAEKISNFKFVGERCKWSLNVA